MVKIDGCDIQLSRGDSLFLRIDLAGRDLPDGTDAIFTVKKNVKNDEILIQKRVNASAEVVSILLSSRETDLPPGVYYWDLRLLIPLPSGGYGVETPMDYAAFVVTEVVGDQIVDETDSEEFPELPAIQTMLAEMRLAIQNADEAVSRVEEAAYSRAPYIGDNQNWWLWNSQLGAYEDSGIAAVAQPDVVELTDAETLGGKAPEYYIQPRNLLDNSDFTNPVNQRGQESYSGASQYTIDRWRTWTKEAAITMVDGGISVTNEALFQYHPLSVLKAENQYTGVVGYADGSVYCAAFAGGEGGGENHLPFKAGYDGGKAFFRINPSEKTVAYAALYEGNYTVETLPPYVPKGYAAELAECQRYYENSWFGGNKNDNLQTLALAWAQNSCEGEFRFLTEKRATPTMTAYGSAGRETVNVYVNGYHPVSDTTWLMRSGRKGAWLRVTLSSAMLTIGYTYGLHAHWEASADL